MYHTRAFILKKNDWNEADWMITALTERFGKLRLRAQGSRKQGAKLRGHLEVGSLAAISFISGRNGYRLTGASLRSYFLGIRSSLLKLRVLAFILFLLEANLMEERDGAGEIFALTREALGALDRAGDAEAARRLSAWFEVNFFRLLGILPSAESEEAERLKSILALAGLPAETALKGAADAGALEAGLDRLKNRLGNAAVIPSVSFADAGV